MSLRRTVAAFPAMLLLLTAGLPAPALAQFATDWQIGLESAATPVMDRVTSFHHLLLVVITVICVIVLGLLVYVMIRFNKKVHPNPSRTTHNTVVEMAWTIIPVAILVIIAVPSFKLLYAANVIPKADMTIKATGHQWYWSYEYPDNGGISFDAILIEDPAELQKTENKLRLLETDTAVVVPVNTTVRVIVTSTDVIHSWAMPSFGIKIDAVPGRLNETWFRVERPGRYYGQCSELCGVRHGYMPINIKAVSQQEFDVWAAKAKEEASLDTGAKSRRLAQVQETDQ